MRIVTFLLLQSLLWLVCSSLSRGQSVRPGEELLIYGFPTQVGTVAMRTIRDQNVEYLIRIIKESDEEEFKIFAAHTIKNFAPIDGDRLHIIQSLRQTTNKKVADALEEALKRPKNQ